LSSPFPSPVILRRVDAEESQDAERLAAQRERACYERCSLALALSRSGILRSFAVYAAQDDGGMETQLAENTWVARVTGGARAEILRRLCGSVAVKKSWERSDVRPPPQSGN